MQNKDEVGSEHKSKARVGVKDRGLGGIPLPGIAKSGSKEAQTRGNAEHL